jgi:hypothetical protein
MVRVRRTDMKTRSFKVTFKVPDGLLETFIVGFLEDAIRDAITAEGEHSTLCGKIDKDSVKVKWPIKW